MSKVRLMAVCPNQHDATSFYRGMGPLISLMKEMDNLEVTNALDQSWGSLKYTDIVFLQRPHLEECVTLAERAKLTKKLLWVDHDDCLLALPESNPHKGIYYRKDIQDNIVTCLKAADIVTVSTPALKAAYERFNKNIVVIPNAWDDDLLPMPKLSKKNSRRLLWRGSSTHDEDLMGVLLSLQHFAQDPSIDIQLLGDPFWLALQTMKGNYTLTPWKGDILDYFNKIKALAPNVVIAPLANNIFNRCKSNIAWMEAAWAGATTIAPDWPEWHRPGCVNYTNNFLDTVKAMLSTDQSVYLNAAREYIKDNLLLSKVNNLRKAIILGT